MNKATLEQEAKKLFGGATIDVQPFNDGIRTAWDVTVVPYMDKNVRFIRVSTAEGEPVVLAYLKKIQQNLLSLNHNGAFGINPVAEKVDSAALEEAIEKKMPKNKETYVCLDCGKKYKFQGPLENHRKTLQKPKQSIASAVNDSVIYKAE